jgi:hypothetical protein
MASGPRLSVLAFTGTMAIAATPGVAECVRQRAENAVAWACEEHAEEECGASGVQSTFITDLVCTSTPDPGCIFVNPRAQWDCEGTCNYQCSPAWEEDGCSDADPGTPCNRTGVDGSPIVIDLDERGFAFTDAAGGVSFDLDSDGLAEQIAWTDGVSRDAFLTLDRNGNGLVDNGMELFGNFTPQPASAEKNGYLALGVFDQTAAGGNADGRLTAKDAIWPSLRLWVDHSHDGVSQSGELHALAALEVSAIGLSYRESRRRDRNGNELRYSPHRIGGCVLRRRMRHAVRSPGTASGAEARGACRSTRCRRARPATAPRRSTRAASCRPVA